jgi:intein-encoded DNA endonuclease-like protein
MKNEIGLKEIYNELSHAHVEINLKFLNELLKDASESESPHRNVPFAKKLGVPINKTKKSAMTIYGWMRGYRTVPMNKLSLLIVLSKKYFWRDVERNLISIKAGIRKGEVIPRFPIKANEGLGSIVGHILGDGSIDKQNHTCFYSNSNLYLLQEFVGYMDEIFGVKPRIWVQKRKSFEEKTEWLKRVNNLKEVPEKHSVGLFYPKICSDFLYAICGKFAEGKEKRITNEIKNFNKDFKKGLIRGFFDDEGSVYSDLHCLRLFQDRKDILEDFRCLLSEFDINSNIVRDYSKRNRLRYYFNISGVDNYIRFYEYIGLTSPKKIEMLKLLVDKVKKSRKFKNKDFSFLTASGDSNPRT